MDEASNVVVELCLASQSTACVFDVARIARESAHRTRSRIVRSSKRITIPKPQCYRGVTYLTHETRQPQPHAQRAAQDPSKIVERPHTSLLSGCGLLGGASCPARASRVGKLGETTSLPSTATESPTLAIRETVSRQMGHARRRRHRLSAQVRHSPAWPQ